ERAILPIKKAITHFKHFAFAVTEDAKRLPHLFFQQLTSCRFCRTGRLIIRDKVAVLAAFFLTDRLIEAKRLLTDTQNLTDFLSGAAQLTLQTGFQRDALLFQVLMRLGFFRSQEIHFERDLISGWFITILLEEL